MSVTTSPRRAVLTDIVARPATRERAFAIDAPVGLGGVTCVALPTRTLSFIGPVSITSQILRVS